MDAFDVPAPDAGRQFRARRALLAPVVVLAVLVAADLLGANQGVLALLLIVLVVVAIVSGMIAGTWKASLVGNRLTASGAPPLRMLTTTGVDLSALSKISSVGLQNGLLTRGGPPVFRPFLLLQDTRGGEAWLTAWGWEDRRTLQALLREAVKSSHAKMDPLSFWRLGFNPSGPGQVSRWRRVL